MRHVRTSLVRWACRDVPCDLYGELRCLPRARDHRNRIDKVKGGRVVDWDDLQQESLRVRRVFSSPQCPAVVSQSHADVQVAKHVAAQSEVNDAIGRHRQCRSSSKQEVRVVLEQETELLTELRPARDCADEREGGSVVDAEDADGELPSFRAELRPVQRVLVPQEDIEGDALAACVEALAERERQHAILRERWGCAEQSTRRHHLDRRILRAYGSRSVLDRKD
eukprot:754545-Hanusia_phi.AAC.2